MYVVSTEHLFRAQLIVRQLRQREVEFTCTGCLHTRHCLFMSW